MKILNKYCSISYALDINIMTQFGAIIRPLSDPALMIIMSSCQDTVLGLMVMWYQLQDNRVRQ